MKQIKIRIKQCVNDELETKCIKNNVSKSEYINGLIIKDLQTDSTDNEFKESIIKSKVELEQILEVVEGVHQSQFEIAKLLNHRNGEKE